MGGPNPESFEKSTGREGQNQAHTSKLHSDAYTPPLNHRVMKPDGTLEHHQVNGPKLTDLSIDTTPGHVVVHDVPQQGASYKERQEAAKREMPISNQHFRELVAKGVDFMDQNDGNFNIQMRNALNEANQSDKSMHSGHNHVDGVLAYANSQLSDSDITLRRVGNKVQVWDAHESTKKPSLVWNLDTNKWEK